MLRRRPRLASSPLGAILPPEAASTPSPLPHAPSLFQAIRVVAPQLEVGKREPQTSVTVQPVSRQRVMFLTTFCPCHHHHHLRNPNPQDHYGHWVHCSHCHQTYHCLG